jgi:hypothetical protein
MFYIHQANCLSAQHTFRGVEINELCEPADKKLLVIEPSYEGIPPGMLRRMGKAVRIGVGTAMAMFQNNSTPDGIIIGTANGGKEDCVRFLNQIIEYDEGLLTPLNFVQSSPNAVPAQIGLLTKNLAYNITHVHLGLAFEFAMIDADMMLNENPLNGYLLGAVDDISDPNYYLDEKGGWNKQEDISNKKLYESITGGSIAGEGATMFLVNGNETGSIARVCAVDTLHHEDQFIVKEKLHDFIERYLPEGEQIDLFLTGENGDIRLSKYYASCESLIKDDVTIARFKHMSGEYPTASAMGLWLCCDILKNQYIPDHMIKNEVARTSYKNILMYNNYKGHQHSFILVSNQ